MRVRKDPKTRKAELLDCGARLCSKWGTANVTRVMVAKATGTTDGLVSRYFGNIEKARKAWERDAKKQGLPIPDAEKSAKLRLKLRAAKEAPSGTVKAKVKYRNDDGPPVALARSLGGAL